MSHTVPSDITPQEQTLRLVLRILSVLFGVAAIAYLLPSLIPGLRQGWMQLPFVTNSVVKVSVLGMVSFVAAGDVRRFRPLTVVVILGHLVSELAMILVLLFGDLNPPDWPPSFLPFSMTMTLALAMTLDGLILTMLTFLFVRADRARYGLKYLNPIEFRALKAAAEAIILGETEVITPEEVARNVDRYLASFKARRKFITKFALSASEFYPLLFFRLPLSYIPRNERFGFLKDHFYQVVALRLFPKGLRMWIQGMIRILSQLSYLGYYADQRSFPSVGYVRFSQRSDTPERLKQFPTPTPRPLQVKTVSDIREEEIQADTVIIGSGAGGSILAHGLVEAGCDVLLLERGDYVDPSAFQEDEVTMLSTLYADGALQLSRDFRFQVLQGSCVGGGTVVNNAVCFDLPDRVLERWNDPQGTNAGLEATAIRAAAAQVRTLLRIERQKLNLNSSGPFFLAGLERLGYHQSPNQSGPVEANIHDCVGCGYCNIGCRYGRKLSMLDEVLPLTQALPGPGRLQILSDCEAMHLEGTGQRIRSVLCRSESGQRLRVRANHFIVAAGAINSSLLLLRSSIGGDRVGQGVSFNAGSPISAVFAQKIDAYAGLQISHYLERDPSRGYILETWFNPPVAQALAMPGWFEDHFRNMERYDRMASIGVLVGTKSTGQVKLGGLLGSEIVYAPDREELGRILEGVVLGGTIFLEGGAEEVLPHTFTYRTYRSRQELDSFPDEIQDAEEVALGTGHPQGGNAISANRAKGVVNPDFGVYGYKNLHLCDASVFPSSIGVNPQLSIMTLAQYAVPRIRAAMNGNGG